MKITIDETNKRITVEEEVLIRELLSFFESHNINANEYKLEGIKTIYSPYPVYPIAPIAPTVPIAPIEPLWPYPNYPITIS